MKKLQDEPYEGWETQPGQIGVGYIQYLSEKRGKRKKFLGFYSSTPTSNPKPRRVDK